MKKITNRQVIIFVLALYFLPTFSGIVGSMLHFKFASVMLRFGIYMQGAIVVSFVLFLLVMFLRRFL